MPAREPLYLFGPFQFDPERRRLTRDSEQIRVPDRHLDILRLLVARAGEIVSKDELVAAGWRDVAVSDNSLEQAMSNLRRRLGADSDGLPAIETLARRGYRFRLPVEKAVSRQTDDALSALLQPHRMFVEGRAALETLEREEISRARAAFEELIGQDPNHAAGHLGLANALAIAFDALRMSGTPDAALAARAVHHAKEACRLDPESGEGWATLAFVLSRAGQSLDAVAAGRRAITIEPENWRHHVRLAYAGWGEERLRAARHALKRLPGIAMAHWLSATVHVARQALDEAERELVTGAAAQDAQPDGGRFGSVGLHLLLGLVRLARGDAAQAAQELGRELSFEAANHIYARQSCANAWCALGAMHLGEGRRNDAIAAFGQAAARVDGHAFALAGLIVAVPAARRRVLQARLDERLHCLEASGARMEAAMLRGVADVHAGRHEQAAARVAAALASIAVVDSAGWTLPIEPLLQVASHSTEWSVVLASLRGRAA